MSALSGLVSGLIWKIAAGLLLLGWVGAGASWWLAARDRDKVQAELVAEKVTNDGLRDSIREQNRAVDGLAKAKADAEARGTLAQQVAAATGKRFDGALAKLVTVKATTCADAMPAVNQLLKDIQ